MTALLCALLIRALLKPRIPSPRERYGCSSALSRGERGTATARYDRFVALATRESLSFELACEAGQFGAEVLDAGVLLGVFEAAVFVEGFEGFGHGDLVGQQ